MAKKIIKEIKTGSLSNNLIDEFSDYAASALSSTKLSSKDILRFRISIETAMGTWIDEVGKGAACSFELVKRFGRATITITCEGKRCNPQDSSNEFGNLSDSALLQSLGLSVGYSYENGINKLKLMPSSGFIMQLKPIFIALTLGVVLSISLKSFAPEFVTNLNTLVVDPIFTALMNILRAIASPLIFLAVLSGIYGIGDIASLGTIGKKLMSRYVIMTYVALLISLGIILSMINFDFGVYQSDSSSIKAILEMVLQFIPTDIVSPFLNGNMLQIITISVACGLVILILSERVSELTKIIDQIYSVVQLLMEAIGHLVPLFIFISIFSFILSNEGIEIQNILKPIIATILTFVMLGLVVYPLIIVYKYKVSYIKLLKKLLPTFVIAITTASSSAAFASNVDTCEKQLGISKKITKFGVPLGQVIYMPIGAAEFLSVSMIMASVYGIEISIPWILTAIFVSGILSIATPPIPGGAISIFTVLFLQLNIPSPALSIALGIDLLLDYIITAGNIMCLQEDLVISADQIGLLNKKELIK